MMWIWALRRGARHARNALRASANLLQTPMPHAVGDGKGSTECYKAGYLVHEGAFLRHFSFSFSSGANDKAGAQSQGNEDDFCELDSPLAEAEAEAEADAEEGEGSDSEAEAEGVKNTTPLIEAAWKCSLQKMPAKLEEWLQQGNVLTRTEVSKTVTKLLKAIMHGRALKVYEWLWEKNPFTFDENDYASRLDLIAKVKGIYSAEKFLETIPSEMKGVLVYRILLANFSRLKDMKKAEEVFQKMKDAGYNLGASDYNSLLFLYKQLNRQKICDVLEVMEQDNVKPDSNTYRILIDIKGLVRDIVGMEQIFKKMKEDGIQSDPNTLAVLAKHYIFAGNTKKAEKLVEEIESICAEKKQRFIHRILLRLYANLGKVIEVERTWTKIESFGEPLLSEYIAGIQAWGNLGEIEKAELIFERLLASGKKLASSRAYNALLHVYAQHNLLLKGKELVKRMSDDGIAVDAITWHSLVRLYLNSGDVEKADAVLLKVSDQKKTKPQYSTLIAILEMYAQRGDIANAEKIFDRLQSAGYTGRIKSYECLLQAYVNAKVPAYGFKERMMADKLFPDRKLSNILQKVNAFKKDSLKTHLISDILD